MELGYGLVTCQRYPGDSRSAKDIYAEALELAQVCERAGIDSIWTSEHHFWDDDYMPSLLVLSAAFAAVTQRLTVGTAVLLAPLYNPIRLAEDAATVDLISGGRFILGLGAGWRMEEFDRLGARSERLGRQMRETVEILRRAWGASTFTYKGEFFSYDATNVTPKPSRQIPIWLGGFAPSAVRRAGRIGDAFLGSSTRRQGSAIEDLSARLELAREGLAASGRDPSVFTFAFHEPVWVTDDPEKDIEEILPHVHYMRWKYADMGAEFGRETRETLPSPPPLDDAARQSILGSLIIGTPEDVAKTLNEFRSVVGERFHFIARSYFPGLPLEKAARSIELLGMVKKLL